MSDPEDQSELQAEPLDALLASDQARLRKVADERISSGMFARVAEAHRREMRGPMAAGWAAAGILAAAGLAVALWIGWPHKAPVPEVAKDVPQKVVEPPATGIQRTPVAQSGAPSVRRLGPNHRRPEIPPMTARGVMPRQPVFPGNTEPTEQERLLMALARNDLSREEKQLPEIAKAISAQVEQEKGQRQAFEKWLQEGGNK